MGLTLAQYAQRVLGYSPLQFGAGTIAMTAMAAAGAYRAQFLTTRVGARAIATAGMALLGAGTLLLARVSVHGGYVSDILPGLLIFGPGLGGGTVAASVAALAGATEREAGLASATHTAAFQIGGAFGAAVLSTIAVSRAAGPDPLAAPAAGHPSRVATRAPLAGLGTPGP